MKRSIINKLESWYREDHAMPLLLRGARQVGKSTLVEQFLQTNSLDHVIINFDLHPEMVRHFDTLDPAPLLNELRLATQQTIAQDKTILFLDEIQECPNAIRALRYFKEKMPQQKVIAAGSLLEFVINDENFRMPVGRIQSMYVKPLSFKEYLENSGQKTFVEFIESITLSTNISDAIHQQLLKQVRNYLILGGMPAVLNDFFQNKDYLRAQRIQTALQNTYRQDFGKYANKSDHRYLQLLFEKIPGLIGDHFKYSHVDPDIKSRELKKALYMLKEAGLVHICWHSNASGLPLISTLNDRIFKVFFVDAGLVTRAGKLAMDLLMNEPIATMNRGALMEQFVAQELLAHAPCDEEAKLFFWKNEMSSTASAEIDFVTTVDAKIIPIEVKSGTTGHLKSLKLFMEKKQSVLGVRFSQQPLSYFDRILSLPLYLVSEMERLVR